jgi:hypothetical protein
MFLFWKKYGKSILESIKKGDFFGDLLQFDLFWTIGYKCFSARFLLAFAPNLKTFFYISSTQKRRRFPRIIGEHRKKAFSIEENALFDFVFRT